MAKRRASSRAGTTRVTAAPHVADIIDQADTSLLDVIDNLLNRGVVVSGDLILALANVDLIYLRLSLLLCASDRLLLPKPGDDVRSASDKRHRR